MESQPKVFNDPVHGHIEMHPLLVSIIDTPEFQRLRNIKQLGGGYFVFPGASHNRFEHSIGVAHLAGKLIQNLKSHTPELPVNDTDILCVQIAGLCHDLGHGPFSYVFEKFMEEANPQRKWRHEETSVKMFEHLIEKHHIKEIMETQYKFDWKDFIFIRKLIYGPNYKADQDEKVETKWLNEDERTPEKKPFLHEIVRNPKTGIDVNIMDYFARDCYHLGMKNNFSHERYWVFARVGSDGHICMRDKEAQNMYKLFHTRNHLYNNAYHHRVVKAIECMLVDALIGANKYQLDKEFRLSEAVDDMEAFIKLTDDILQPILRSPYKEIAEARCLIERLLKRDLYQYIDGKLFRNVEGCDWTSRLQVLAKAVQNVLQANPPITSESFHVEQINLDYGKDKEDPIKSIRFYRRNDPNTVIYLTRDEVSYLLPSTFCETKVMLLCKVKNKDQRNVVIEEAKKHLKTFWPEEQAEASGPSPPKEVKGLPPQTLVTKSLMMRPDDE